MNKQVKWIRNEGKNYLLTAAITEQEELVVCFHSERPYADAISQWFVSVENNSSRRSPVRQLTRHMFIEVAIPRA